MSLSSKITLELHSDDDEVQSARTGESLVTGVVDAASRASGRFLALKTEHGVVLHESGDRSEEPLKATTIEVADGSTLMLEGALDEEQLDAVARLVGQAVATHFELAETKLDLGRSQRELSLIFEFSQSVCRVDSVEDVVDRFLFDIVHVLEAKEGTFLALDKERKELTIVCHHGSTPETITDFRLPLGEGIAGKVALDGRPRIVNDTSKDPDYVASVNPIRNVICVPIRLGGEVVGVVSINDRHGGEPFEPSHLRLLSSLAQLGEIGLENARLYEQIRGLLFEAVDGLVTFMEAQAPHTVGHSRRVARLAYSIGRRMAMSPQILERLYLAALVHDLGASAPPPEHPSTPWSGLMEVDSPSDEGTSAQPSGIIRSAGRLTELLPGLGEHRERYDGAGHPRGLRGEEISVHGRIIAIAHAFDAATHTPQWQKARSPAQALEEIQVDAGSRFDPAIVDEFTAVYDLLRLENWVPPDEEDIPWKSSGAIGLSDDEE